MQYVVRADRPFEEIETRAIGALEHRGFVVQRTFSLRSAMRSETGSDSEGPGYSVLLLHAATAQHRPLGLVILYEREGQTVIKTVLRTPAGDQSPSASASTDTSAELVAALVRGGLEFCVDTADGQACIDPGPSPRDCKVSERPRRSYE
jgi:hypothetical protein